MLYLRLFLEYFYAGLFSVGGGLATIPFLQDMGARTGWFTSQELANMIAVSEATPGPMGVNMATYVGFTTGGPFGSVIATLGLVAPSIIVIILVSVLLHRFRDNRYVDSFFYGLRPASTALISSPSGTPPLGASPITCCKPSTGNVFRSLCSWCSSQTGKRPNPFTPSSGSPWPLWPASSFSYKGNRRMEIHAAVLTGALA